MKGKAVVNIVATGVMAILVGGLLIIGAMLSYTFTRSVNLLVVYSVVACLVFAFRGLYYTVKYYRNH